MEPRTLRIGERTLRVATNDPTIDAYLARACARFAAEPDVAHDPSLSDEGTIDWDGRAGVVRCNGRALDLPAAAIAPLEVGVVGVAALLAHVMRRLRRQQAFYATGVSKGTACIAIAAAPGVGKTTLALELLCRGWAAFGDEFLLIDRESMIVEPIPVALMVREPSIAAVGDERLERLTRRMDLVSNIGGVRTWHDVDVAETFGPDAVATPRRLTHLVVYRRSEDGVSALEPVSPAAAALEILPHFFIDALEMKDIWETVERFQGVKCFRLRATDQRSAADLLETLV